MLQSGEKPGGLQQSWNLQEDRDENESPLPCLSAKSAHFLNRLVCHPFKSPRAQKINRLPDGNSVAHQKWVRGVNDNVVRHACQFGPFDGHLSIVWAGNSGRPE